MAPGSKIFVPRRSLGYVSNHIPLKVRYIKSRQENLIITCVGRSFHTYGISHFGLLSVSDLHQSDITCLEADAFHVYTSCDNIIYAWRRGTELKHTYRGHKKFVHLMLAFGAHLISIDESSVVKVWDIKDETVLLELTFNNESFRITTILHPMTYINKILLGSEQGSLQLWNINTSKLIYTFKGWKVPVSCLEQAPANDVVAVGLLDGRIILHNLKFDRKIMAFTQDWGVVTSISFRADGRPIMATGGATGHIVFWNLEERRVSSQLAGAHDATVTGMICLPNEPLMITSSPDNTLKLWIFDMSDGSARLLRIREGHSSVPTFVRYHSSDGHNILSASGDSTIRIFNTQAEIFNKCLGKASYNRKISKKKGRLVEDRLKMPPVIEFSSELTREKDWDNIAAIHLGLPIVTTWSYDNIKMGTLKLLPDRLYSKKRDFNVDVVATCLCITHCGNFVLIGYSSGHVDRFNMQSGIWRDGYGNPKAHNSAIRGVATDSLNELSITGADCEVKFWTFKKKGSKAFKVLNLEEPINFFRVQEERSLLAVALVDFTVLILDVDTKSIVRKFVGHTGQINDATFTLNSRWLITSSMDCSIRTWDIVAARLIDQFRTETACVSLSMSPTADSLVTAHVDYIALFLWSNKTLYSRITLRALSPDEEPPLITLPEVQRENIADMNKEPHDPEEFVSPEQISNELITLSGVSSSRWYNLLQIQEINMKNKPKKPSRTLEAAPFFLPTIPSLNIQFNVTPAEAEDASKLLVPVSLVNLSEFGKLLMKMTDGTDYKDAVEKLKSLGPSLIDFEIKALCPEEGGSIEVMMQFFKMIEFVLKSNQNFELAQAYLSVFLKSHGVTIASEKSLRNYLPNVWSCLSVSWHRIEERLLYCSCVIQNLKNM